MYRILVAERLSQSALDQLGAYPDVSVDVRTDLSRDELLSIIPEYEALIIRSGTQVTADVLAAGKNLRVVGRAGVGVDNINVKAATMQGVVVMNTPGANSIATAELTLALMLAVSRNILPAHASLAARQWQRGDFVGRQLYRKLLGCIGFGRVGKLVAERARAFGMDVVVYDPWILEETARELDVVLVELDELLAQSDYITLHAALTPDTFRLINEQTIALMKDGAILINVGSGDLVDEQALAIALTNGKLAGAAVDVYSSEPPPADHPLIGLPTVIHIPHLGASTREVEYEVGMLITRQVVSALRGTDYSCAVNLPFELEGDFASINPYLELAETIGRLQVALADKPIKRLEIQVSGDAISGLVRAIGAGLLKGVLESTSDVASDVAVNYVNAPALAAQAGLSTTQTMGLDRLDYPNLVSCRAVWEDGRRLIAGVLFGGSEPRIVQIDEYRLEARPEGIVLILQNKDVPGVIGRVGTLLAAHKVNIGEWRLGRVTPGGEALSFINLDSEPSAAVMNDLAVIENVTQARVVRL